MLILVSQIIQYSRLPADPSLILQQPPARTSLLKVALGPLPPVVVLVPVLVPLTVPAVVKALQIAPKVVLQLCPVVVAVKAPVALVALPAVVLVLADVPTVVVLLPVPTAASAPKHLPVDQMDLCWRAGRGGSAVCQ